MHFKGFCQYCLVKKSEVLFLDKKGSNGVVYFICVEISAILVSSSSVENTNTETTKSKFIFTFYITLTSLRNS